MTLRVRQIRTALSATVISLALLPSTVSHAGLFGRGPATDIRSLLALLPAVEWAEGVKGFSAFNLAAMRSHLALEWPDVWPSLTNFDPVAAETVYRFHSQLQPEPSVLTWWGAETGHDEFAEIGLDAMAAGGIAEYGAWRREDQIGVVVGDGVADAARLEAALGPANPLDGAESLGYWDARDGDWAGNLRGGQMLALPPDIVVIREGGPNVSQLADVITGASPNLSDEPAVDALLHAVDGPGWGGGDLVALWAMHPAELSLVFRLPSDEWPANADLPAYRMVAYGLRYDAGVAHSMLVLIYDDLMAAENARVEMAGRLAFAEHSTGMAMDGVSVVETSAELAAVMVTAHSPINTSDESGRRHTAYHAWTLGFSLYLDMWLVAPMRSAP